MVFLGLLFGLVGTDTQFGRAALHLRPAGALRRHRLRRRRHGAVRHRRDHRPTSSGRADARNIAAKIGRLMPTREEFQPRVAGGRCAARRSARSSACCPAAAHCSRPFASYALEKKVSRDPDAIRQRRDRRRGGPGIGQQRRRADLVHSTADARHSVQPDHGGDGRRDDHPGHRARPARDDRDQPELFWGIIASMWIGNLMLVIINLPLIGMWVRCSRCPTGCCSRRSCCSAAIGVYSLNSSRLRGRHDRGVRPAWLRVLQARLRGRAIRCSASSSAR